MKRVLAISDLHCGALNGLTPPEFQTKYNTELYKIQKEFWNWFTKSIKSLGKIDVCFLLGDLVEGKQKKAGNTDIITADMQTQASIASRCVKQINANKYVFIRGTNYHVFVDGIEVEDLIASEFENSYIGNQLFTNINDVIFDLKHKVGGSTIPHGRFTALAKERLWNVLWNETKNQPKADVLLRGHVHYYSVCQNSMFTAMSLPAMQIPYGGNYGEKCCSGIVDVGYVVFEVDEGKYSWNTNLYTSRTFAMETIKI